MLVLELGARDLYSRTARITRRHGAAGIVTTRVKSRNEDTNLGGREFLRIAWKLLGEGGT